MWNTLKLFLNPFDARYEDLAKGPKHLVVLRDFSAGLIVAMMAIPLAMGFAMASGLKTGTGNRRRGRGRLGRGACSAAPNTRFTGRRPRSFR